MADDVVVYGSDWCGYSTHLVHTLKALGVAYHYVDVDESPEDEQRIANWNNGRAIVPTINLQGEIFVNPDDSTLFQELKKRGLLMSAKRSAR